MFDKEGEINVFLNPSKKIKVIANVLLVINTIASFVFAFVFGKKELRPDYDFHFGFFILILVIGLLFGYIIPLLIYGFGQLIENTNSTKNETEQDNHTSRLASFVPNAPNAPYISTEESNNEEENTDAKEKQE